MVRFYGGSSSNDSLATQATFAPTRPFARQPAPAAQADAFDDVGKTELDLTDPSGSIGEAIGSIAQFGAGLVGGAAGVVGSIGIPGGPTLGDIPPAIDAGLRAVGSVELPYLGPEGERGRARTLGDVPTVIEAALNAPSEFIEREFGAEYRVRSFLEREQRAQSFRETFGRDPTQTPTLPPDIAYALETGQMTADEAADELVARGAGYSDNPVFNLAGQILFDPLNFILPGIGLLTKGAKGAGVAIRAGDTIAQLGLPRYFAGTAYNTVTRGMSAAGQGAMGFIMGPATKGVFHSLGINTYKHLAGGLGRISSDYAHRFTDALARGTAQFYPAVVARQMADEVELGLRRGGGGSADDIVRQRVLDRKAIDEAELERAVEDLADSTIPSFNRVPVAEMTAQTVRKLASIIGSSTEDALRALGGRVSKQQARMVHLAFYGKAGHELEVAKAAAVGAKNIDVERLIVLAPENLTDVRADELLKAIDAGDADAVVEAVNRYDDLARFRGTAIDHARIRDYVQALKQNDVLTHQVKLPVSGKNALPKSLGQWRKTYNEFGYEIGFAPEGGWKAVIDDAGQVHYTSPFVNFVDEATPLTFRNPLGRFTDSLFRGITQTKIVRAAMLRFDEQAARVGIAEEDARRIFNRILDEAKERQVSPRAVGTFGGHEFDRIFAEVIGEDAVRELASSPTWLVMQAFEGNLRHVGLTQKFTGGIKRVAADFGNMPSAIADGIYPLLRFKYRPVFQMQELIESLFWNVFRGISPTKPASETAARIMLEMSELGPEFRYTYEAGYATHLAGDAWAKRLASSRSRIGRALGHLIPEGGVKGFKERHRLAQVFHEHGDYFKSALDKANPRLFREMAEAYGTNDARIVAQRFIEERVALATDPNAIRAFIPKAGSRAEETILQAFEESWRQSMQQAFKTHYFSSRRGWLERTINHPYLGLYPASYMWGKVIPEFARFLLKKPFGLDAPLLGLAAYEKVQEAVVEASTTDPEFAQFLKDNDGAIYAAQMMLPGLPDEIPVHAPAWARHFSRDIQQGDEIDPEQFFVREAGDIAVTATPARDVRDIARAGADVVDLLTRAAAEYDGIFGQPTQAPPTLQGNPFPGLQP